MLDQCRAFVITAGEPAGRTLETTAHQLGFGDVVDSHAASGAGRRHITFFLVDGRLSDEALVDVIEAVREEHRGRLCYSPIILFTGDTSPGTGARYVRFGFDDVIVADLPLALLRSRLAVQVSSVQRYVETKDYFGPDRRRLDRGTDVRVNASAYTQVLFERDPQRGIRILGREERGQRFRPQPTAGAPFMPRLFGHNG